MKNFDTRDSLAEKASSLRLKARSISNGIKAGSFRSYYRGQGIEFSDVREYLRGDDVRSIDWNVTARMGKPFVKLYEEDRELAIFIVLDRSLSMLQAAGGRSRLSVASEAAAILALAAEQSNCPVGAVFFGGKLDFSCAPDSGRNNVMLILSKLDEEPDTEKKGSVLVKALRGTARLLKKKSLVFILSDFRVSGYEDELARLALRHEVIAVRCTDPCDEELPEVGCIPFYDLENNIDRILPTSLSSFRRAWRDDALARHKRWQSVCAKRGVMPLVLSTESDPVLILSNYFLAGNVK